jgi:hypothetical protein
VHTPSSPLPPILAPNNIGILFAHFVVSCAESLRILGPKLSHVVVASSKGASYVAPGTLPTHTTYNGLTLQLPPPSSSQAPAPVVQCRCTALATGPSRVGFLC